MLLIDDGFKIVKENRQKKNEDGFQSQVNEADKTTDQADKHADVFVTTTGLAIHSFADGAALGASLFLGEIGNDEGSSLGLVIFVAIMLHKLPSSIGFGTFLLHSGKKGYGVLKHLCVFTLSSPIACILTYFILSLSAGTTASYDQIKNL